MNYRAHCPVCGCHFSTNSEALAELCQDCNTLRCLSVSTMKQRKAKIRRLIQFKEIDAPLKET